MPCCRWERREVSSRVDLSQAEEGRETHEDEQQRDDGCNGRDETVLSEREDEETGGQHPGEGHGANEAVLGDGDAAVLVALAVVDRVGPARRPETDKARDDESDVRKAADALRPACARESQPRSFVGAPCPPCPPSAARRAASAQKGTGVQRKTGDAPWLFWKHSGMAERKRNVIPHA